MMLREASALIREREGGWRGESRAKERSDLRIHRRGHQVDHKSPSYLHQMKDLFSSASKQNYASEHTLRRSFKNESSPSLIMPNISR